MTAIVLQHGLFGFGDFQIGNFKLSYFNGIDRAIEKRGHPLIVSRVHPTGSIARRASELKQTILKQLSSMTKPNARVVILAHSMGGLDARYMISKLGMEDRVAALVTFSTPHRGSAYADWCLEHVGKRLGGLQLMRMLDLDVEAISNLTMENCARFNEEIIDSPNVKYFSVSASRPWHRVPPFYMHSHKVIRRIQGANDGLVAVESAKWGEHLGTWPADHLHMINKRMVIEVKEPTGDISPRYMKVLDYLQSLGVMNGDA